MEQKMTPIRKKPKLTKSDYYFKCAFCPEELDDDAALKVHIESKHLDDLFKFPCEYCEFVAQGPKFLRQHQSEDCKVLVGQKEHTVKTDSVVDLDKTEENSEDIETIENINSFVMSSSTGDGQQNIPTLQKSSVKKENQDIKKEITKDESELDLAVNEESNIDKIFNNVASPR